MKKVYIPIIRKFENYGIVYKVTKLEKIGNLSFIHIIHDNKTSLYLLPEFYNQYVIENSKFYKDFVYGKDFKYLEFGKCSQSGNFFVKDSNGINLECQAWRLKEIEIIKEVDNDFFKVKDNY